MKADSLVPPARRGVARGCGKAEAALVDAEAMEEGGGERMKPPDNSMVSRSLGGL